MRYPVMLAAMALGVAMSFGHAVADGPDDGYGAREVGTVRFIDRDLNLIQLEDGTELRTTDARMLQTSRKACGYWSTSLMRETGTSSTASRLSEPIRRRVSARPQATDPHPALDRL